MQERWGWISEHWAEIPIVALAAACFAAAQAVGGSGFIACFVGGLLLSGLGGRHKAELLRGAEHMGEALALFTWAVFGGIVVARMIDRVTWPALFYAVLSLTVVRMLPVFLCLIGTRSSTADKLFIGWFGPRGLATIVFAILVLDEKLPGNDTIVLAAGWTVLLSIVAHGVTANPLVRAIGRLGCVRLLPGEEEADVAGHSSRILDHLCLQAKTERPQVIMPEFVAELGSALQGLLPVGQRVVDPSTAIGA